MGVTNPLLTGMILQVALDSWFCKGNIIFTPRIMGSQIIEPVTVDLKEPCEKQSQTNPFCFEGPIADS